MRCARACTYLPINRFALSDETLRVGAAPAAPTETLKAELTADVARGEYRALSRTTVREYAAEWIESYRVRTSRGFRPTTRQEYRRDLERDIVPYFGKRRLTKIEPRDIKQFASHLATNRNLSPGSVRLVIAPLRAMLATAFEEGLIRSNPAANLRLAQTRKHDGMEDDVKAMTATELGDVVSDIRMRTACSSGFLQRAGCGSAKRLPCGGPTSTSSLVACGFSGVGTRAHTGCRVETRPAEHPAVDDSPLRPMASA